jgi:hypothetical protein
VEATAAGVDVEGLVGNVVEGVIVEVMALLLRSILV